MKANGRTIPACLVLLMLTFLLAACGTGSLSDEGSSVGPGAQPEESSVMQADLSESVSEASDHSQSEQIKADGDVSEGGSQIQNDQNTSAGQKVPDAGNDNRITAVRLSFASYAYVDSGDESISKMIRNVEVPLENPEGSQETLLLGIIDALRSIPQGLEGAETMVSDLYRINSITVSSGTAVVDITGDGIANASEYDEEFFVYQVADSILHSVSSIQRVRFTVDGTQDTGMAYLDIHQDFDAAACDAFCG